MDYASIPWAAEDIAFDIPDLLYIEYDFRGLEDFPSRHGFMKDGILDLETKSAEECASFLQSWLHYGLLAELRGELFERHSIRAHFADARRLDIVLTAHWMSPYGEPSLKKLKKCIQLAIVNSQKIDSLHVAEKHPMPIVMLSVKILICQLINYQKNREWKRKKLPPIKMLEKYNAKHVETWNGALGGPRLLPLGPTSQFIAPCAKLLSSYMLVHGWCPSHIHQISTSYDYSMAYYLSRIERKAARSEIHRQCSTKHCQAYNSSPEDYITSHTRQGCQCSFVAVSTADIVKIIEEGSIPLIAVEEGPHGRLEIRVEAATASSQYTAISHVWSDGMGNVQANALLHCQLQYISKCVSQLPTGPDRGIYYEHGSFLITRMSLDGSSSSKSYNGRLVWMDTLCIPVDEQYAHLRVKAINKMNAVYARARKVLVLESEMQQLSLKTTAPTQVLAQLAYSSWMGRCWTLQEGAAGRACYVQCSDGALALDVDYSGILLEKHRALVSYVFRYGFLYCRLFLRHWRAFETWPPPSIMYSDASVVENSEPEDEQERINRAMRARLSVRQPELDPVDENGLLQADAYVEAFVCVWNDLIRRSTTKSEDCYAILANLLNYIVSPITRLAPNQRLKAILWSSDYLPFSLMYNCGPRLRATDKHRERWVPTEPRGSRLTTYPLMRFADDDDALCLVNDSEDNLPVFIQLNLQALPRYCFVVDTKRGTTYFVKTFRSVGDDPFVQEHCATILIIQRPDIIDSEDYTERSSMEMLEVGPKTRGACFHATSLQQSQGTTSTTSHYQISGIPLAALKTYACVDYDCPVRVWQVPRLGDIPRSELNEYEAFHKSESCSIFEGESLEKPYSLRVQLGKSATASGHELLTLNLSKILHVHLNHAGAGPGLTPLV